MYGLRAHPQSLNLKAATPKKKKKKKKFPKLLQDTDTNPKMTNKLK